MRNYGKNSRRYEDGGIVPVSTLGPTGDIQVDQLPDTGLKGDEEMVKPVPPDYVGDTKIFKNKRPKRKKYVDA